MQQIVYVLPKLTANRSWAWANHMTHNNNN